MDIERIAKQIERIPCSEVGAGALEAEILFAARSLNVMFPDSFKAFLRRFGWISLYGFETYGLGVDVPAHLHLVRNTLEERSTFQPKMPSNLIPVVNDGSGNYFSIDTSHLSHGESPIVFWDHEGGADQTPVVVSRSFIAWLGMRLDDVTERNTQNPFRW